uniref:Uncharacterized protein n=1 Tax=viral metagenome TaxID=1070528 RepID=A0A6C0AEL5_9ZZZZ
MEIKISEIPDFLKDSEFYKNLNLNSDEVPELNDEINNFMDFKEIFETLNYFHINKYPETFIEYYEKNSQEVFDSLDKNLFEHQELLKNLCHLKIKNDEQFLVVYKIIFLYKLKTKDYNINYNQNKLSIEEKLLMFFINNINLEKIFK